MLTSWSPLHLNVVVVFVVVVGGGGGDDTHERHFQEMSITKGQTNTGQVFTLQYL